MAAAINPDGAEVLPGFLQQFHPAFPVGIVNYTEGGAFMQLTPGVRAFVPWMLFIDRQGTIQTQYTGNDPFLADEATQSKSIRDEVLKLLAQPGAAKKRK